MDEVERRETHVGLGQRGDEAPQGESQKTPAASPHLPDPMARPATSAWVRLGVINLLQLLVFTDSSCAVLVGRVDRTISQMNYRQNNGGFTSTIYSRRGFAAGMRLFLWLVHCLNVSHGQFIDFVLIF